MSIFTDLNEFFYKKNRKTSSTSLKKAKSEQKVDVLPFSPRTSWGLPEPSPLDSQAQIESYHSWVYACVSKRAQELANINLVLLRKKANGEPEEAKKHEVLELLYNVNPFCTFYDLIELTGTYMDLAGEAFWWLVRSPQGKIVQIYPYFSPANMEIATSPKEFIKGYIYNVPGTSQKIPFESKDILHFKYVNPLNPYRGLSPVKAAELSISSDREAAIYNWRFFKNSAVPPGVLKLDKELDDATYERIKAQWDAAHKGTNNAFKVGILEKGISYENIGVGRKEADFLETRKFSREEILTIFKTPKSVLGITEDVNRANAEATIAMFREQVIMPNMKKLVTYLNEFLLPNYSDDVFFDFDNPVPANQEMELLYYHNGITDGWLTPNEVREWEGLEAIEGGDSTRQPFSSPFQLSLKPKSKRRTMIQFKRTTLGEKILETIKPEVLKKMKKIVSKKTITALKEQPKKAYDEKFADYIHKNKVAKTNADEKQMITKLRKEFERQQKETLAQLNQKNAGDVDFDEEGEARLFAEIFNPEFEQFWKTHGDDAMRLLGIDEFDITPAVRKKIKAQAANFAADVSKTTAQKIKNHLQLGLDDGESIPELSQRIRDVFKEATTSRAEMIARTEVSKAVGSSSIEAWEQSGVVEKKQWITAKDERVEEICLALDGQVVGLNGTFEGDDMFGEVQSEPAHINCRCDVVPIV